jgi:hypothetical protein
MGASLLFMQDPAGHAVFAIGQPWFLDGLPHLLQSLHEVPHLEGIIACLRGFGDWTSG